MKTREMFQKIYTELINEFKENPGKVFIKEYEIPSINYNEGTVKVEDPYFTSGIEMEIENIIGNFNGKVFYSSYQDKYFFSNNEELVKEKSLEAINKEKSEKHIITIKDSIKDYLEIKEEREAWDYPLDELSEAKANNEYIVISEKDNRIYEVSAEEFYKIQENLSINEEITPTEKAKEQLQRLNAIEDVKALTRLYNKVLSTEFKNQDLVVFQDDITTKISKQIEQISKENNITSKEGQDILILAKKKQREEEHYIALGEQKLTDIFECCSTKEIVEILKNEYDYSLEEVLYCFDGFDKETIEEAEETYKNLCLQEEQEEEE